MLGAAINALPRRMAAEDLFRSRAKDIAKDAGKRVKKRKKRLDKRSRLLYIYRVRRTPINPKQEKQK